MERDKELFRRTRKPDKHSYIRTKKDNRKIIIKSKDTLIKVYRFYIEVIRYKIKEKIPISFINFDTIYINKNVKISLNDLYRLSKQVKVYIIDGNGYLLMKVKNIEKE